MNFAEAEAYLLSLGNEVSAMKLGLDNMRALLTELGNPQKKYLKVQVAGTNGKGSVCAFLKSICLEAEIIAGVYTSPHLVSVTERINVAGSDIGEVEFAALATRVRDVAEKMLAGERLEYRPTFFEHLTAMALIAFADAEVEVAILETGLGGRLDATTAANAEIAVITRIDLDHQEYLGDTLEDIAAEKAAIIRPDSKVVIGPQEESVSRIFLDRCREFGIIPESADKESRALGVVPGLRGKHQLENAQTAAMAAGTLSRDFHVNISEAQIRRGTKEARHPGRLEACGSYLLDGAHNIGGARALAKFLTENEHRPITIVFGAMKGKDVGGMADILFPLADQIVLTHPENLRAMGVDELAALTEREVIKTTDVADAIRVAEDITPEDGIILVTGSLYLVGEVKKSHSHI